MPVTDKHPEYAEHVDQWCMIRDCLKGEPAVKKAGIKYYPMSGGQAAQEAKAGACGAKGPYEISKTMARFPELLEPAAMGFTGLATRIPWEVKNLPASMEYIRDDAGQGMNIEGWQSKLIYSGLTMGRYVLFPDSPVDGGRPEIKFYCAESFINWDEDDNDLLYGVFKEQKRRDDLDMFSHDSEDCYRVVRREGNQVIVEIWAGKDEASMQAGEPIEVSYSEIPIIIGGTTENSPTVQRPPLIGIAECALSAYRLSASLRWALRAMADPIILALGFSENEIQVVGAGTILEKDVEPGKASIEYVEMSGSGLGMVANEIQMEIERGEKAGHSLKEKGGIESSKTTRQQSQSKNATLKSIDRCAAQAFQDSLNLMARIQSLPDNIEVVTSLDYTDDDIEATVLTALSNVVDKGQLPKRAIPEYTKKRGMFEDDSIEDLVGEIEQLQEARESMAAGLLPDNAE